MGRGILKVTHSALKYGCLEIDLDQNPSIKKFKDLVKEVSRRWSLGALLQLEFVSSPGIGPGETVSDGSIYHNVSCDQFNGHVVLATRGDAVVSSEPPKGDVQPGPADDFVSQDGGASRTETTVDERKTFTMYHSSLAPQSVAPLAVLAASGASYRSRCVDVLAGEQGDAAFRALNSRHSLPTLVADDGTVITEPSAVLLALVRDAAGARDQFGLPAVESVASAAERARAESALEWCVHDFWSPLLELVPPRLLAQGQASSLAEHAASRDTSALVARVRKRLDDLEHYWLADGNRSYIGGESRCLADLAVAAAAPLLQLVPGLGPVSKVVAQWLSNVHATTPELEQAMRNQIADGDHAGNRWPTVFAEQAEKRRMTRGDGMWRAADRLALEVRRAAPSQLFLARASSPCMACWLLLETARVPYTLVEVDLAKGEHRKPSYTAVNPCQKVPAWSLADPSANADSWNASESGQSLTMGTTGLGSLPPIVAFESGAILRTVCALYPRAAAFYPTAPRALRARVDEALAWRHSSLAPVLAPLVYPALGFAKFSADEVAKATAALPAVLAAMESRLLKGTAAAAGPFVGGAAEPTIADFALAPVLRMVPLAAAVAEADALAVLAAAADSSAAVPLVTSVPPPVVTPACVAAHYDALAALFPDAVAKVFASLDGLLAKAMATVHRRLDDEKRRLVKAAEEQHKRAEREQRNADEKARRSLKKAESHKKAKSVAQTATSTMAAAAAALTPKKGGKKKKKKTSGGGGEGEGGNGDGDGDDETSETASASHVSEGPDELSNETEPPQKVEEETDSKQHQETDHSKKEKKHRSGRKKKEEAEAAAEDKQQQKKKAENEKTDDDDDQKKTDNDGDQKKADNNDDDDDDKKQKKDEKKPEQTKQHTSLTQKITDRVRKRRK